MAVRKGGTFARAVANAGQASATSKTGIVQSIGSGTVDVLMNDNSGLRQKVKVSGGPTVVGAEVTIVEVDGKPVAQVSAGEARSARGAGLVIINNNIGGSGNGFPLAHAATHQAGGSDALTPAMIGAAVQADINAAIAAHLADDDAHPEYLLASGARALTGTLTTQALLPDAPDTRDVGSALMRYRRGYFTEIDNVIFAQDTISVHQNMLIVPKGSGTLPELVYSAATSIDFGAAMTLNDIVILNGVGAVEYVQVGTLVSGTEYNVTRNLDGTGANEWPAGTIWVNYGYNGAGRIVLDDTDGEAKLSILLQGATYNATTEVLRMGQMNGSFGVATDVWGLGVGDYAGGNYIRYDTGSGFRLKAGDDAVSINEDGILLLAGAVYNPKNEVKFADGSARSVLAMGSQVIGGGNTFSTWLKAGEGANANGYGGLLTLSAKGKDPNGTGTYAQAVLYGSIDMPTAPQVDISVYDTGVGSTHVAGTTHLKIFGDRVTLDNPLDATDGLNVGTATGAVAGEIKASGAIRQSTAIGARVYNDAATTLTTGVVTILTFNQERFDTDSIHDTSSNSSRLTCKTAGVYAIYGSASFAANATGMRQLFIRLNGTTNIAPAQSPAATFGRTHIWITTVYNLAVNGYVELTAFQDSGGNLTVDYIGNTSPEFGMVRIA